MKNTDTNTSSTTPSPAPQKNGCLKPFLIIWSIGSILLFVFAYDKCSGNAEDRLERKEIKRIEALTLPSEFKSYQYLSDATSTDRYEVEKISDSYLDSYYFLPDKTLVVSGKESVIKIDADGKVVAHLSGVSLDFYGTTLAKCKIFVPPVIKDDRASKRTRYSAIETPEAKPVLSGYYSHWPTTGDTTLYVMEPLSKIFPNDRNIIDAYEKADVVKDVNQYGYEPVGTMLLIDGVWYITDNTINKPSKAIHSSTNSQSQSLKIRHKQPTDYTRERSYVSWGGGSGSYTPESWSGDAYVQLIIGGDTRFPFKESYDEKKGESNSYVSVNAIQTNRYAVLWTHIIRKK